MKLTRRIHTGYRIGKLMLTGLLSRKRVGMAQIVPMRRCNLDCTYCNEYDKVSEPVPLPVMLERIDKLAEFGTAIITISGGEPLLHPEVEAIIARIRSHGAIAGMITNAYLLSDERIASLNAAGLDNMQISIDNVAPDEVSKKSLKLLDRKLVKLAEQAAFDVNINSVLGSGVKDPGDALTIARRALELGFTSSLGIIHDTRGSMQPLDEREQGLFRQIMSLGKRSFTRLGKFQHNLAAGKPNDWRCRAGGRYLYVCEAGLVHYCSQQRGYPAIPLLDYTPEDVLRGYETKKDCAPGCTIGCVHRLCMFENWRSPQEKRRPILAPVLPELLPVPVAARRLKVVQPLPGTRAAVTSHSAWAD